MWNEPIGLEFVILDLAVFGALLGRSGLRELHGMSERWQPAGAILTLVVAGMLALIYSRVAGFAATFQISPVGHGLHEGLTQLSPVLRGR